MNVTGQNDMVEGWVWGPSRRGTVDILWTSILTIVLCSWNTLYLNISPRHWTKRRRFYQKLLFFGLSILSPEFILQIAFGQWASARRSVKAFKAVKHDDRGSNSYNPWTIRHAFLADMGCFRLETEDCRDYPLDANQVHYLVTRGYVRYSQVAVSKSEIDDRDKGGGILLLITVLQIIWFSLSLNGRAWFGNSLTQLELSAIAFVLPTLVTFWLWRHKPLDTSFTITLTPNVTVAQMKENHEHEAKEFGIPKSEHAYMPLHFIGQEPKRHPWLGRIFTSSSRQIKISDANCPRLPRWSVAVCILFEALYVGIHVWGWDFFFASTIERDLWRGASFTMGVCTAGFWSYHFYVNHCHKRLLSAVRTATGRSERRYIDTEVERGARRNAVTTLGGFVATPDNYSGGARGTSLISLVPIIALAVIYVLARGFIIVECFASLRKLPQDAYRNIMLKDVLRFFQ
jgi:hypothetical protein